MEVQYRFELAAFSEAELETVSSLLRQVFRNAPYLTPRYLRWQYVDNPDGRALACNAWLRRDMVGHCAAMPLRATVDGAALRGLFFINTAVHPAHMGRSLSRGMTNALFEEAPRQGYDFAFGMGNAYSTLPMLTRFKLVAPLQAKLGIGAPRRRPPAGEPSFERLWSAETLRWRLANPERPYSLRSRDGSLSVIAPTGRPGIGALLYHGANDWNLEDRGPRPPGPLKVWLGLDPGIDWRRSAFLTIPAALKPSPLNFVFKDLSGGPLCPDPARAIFRAIDFDPF